VDLDAGPGLRIPVTRRPLPITVRDAITVRQSTRVARLAGLRRKPRYFPSGGAARPLAGGARPLYGQRLGRTEERHVPSKRWL
jgi:hypothetical protein